MNNQDQQGKQQLWYLRREGAVQGPYVCGVIRRFLVLGRATLRDEVSLDAEHWQPITEVPEVIPPGLRRAVDEDEGDEYALLTRMREDERTGIERRTAESDEQFEGQRKGERRQAEPNVIKKHRAARTTLTRLYVKQDKPMGRAIAASATLLLLAAMVVFYSAEPISLGPDCQAPPSVAVNWNNCRIEGLDAASKDLSGANMNNAKLHGAKLSGANLSRSDLRYADLGGADLSYTQLKDAQLKGANLQNADLAYADLTGTDLSFSDLRGANPGGAVFEGARLDEAIWFDGDQCLPGSIGECFKPRK